MNSEITHAIAKSLQLLNRTPGQMGPDLLLKEAFNLDSLEVVELAALACRELGLGNEATPDLRGVETLAELVTELERLTARSSAA